MAVQAAAVQNRRLPSSQALEPEIADKRRATISLEASADAVLRVLEAAIQA